MKKLLLAAGTAATAITPVLTVVSCAPDEDKTIVIDLAKMDSPQALIDEMNKNMHFVMSRTDAARMAGGILSEKGFLDIKSYMDDMNVSKNIRLEYKDKSYTMETSDLKKASETMSEILDKGYDKLPYKNGANIGVNLMGKDAPEMMYYAPELAGFTYALGMSGFLQIVGQNYDTDTGTTDTTSLIANHEYFNLLREWHKIAWSFVNSEVYKDWMGITTAEDKTDDKKFELIDPNIELKGTDNLGNGVFLDNKLIKLSEYGAGQYFDKNDETVVGSSPTIKPEHHTDVADNHVAYELSNFEAQLLQSILNLTHVGL